MSLYDFVIISIFLFYLWSLSVAVPLDNSRELTLLMSAGISVVFLLGVDIIHLLSHLLYLFLCFCVCLTSTHLVNAAVSFCPV